MRFAFGQFPVNVDGDEGILETVSTRFRKYLTTEGPSDYQLHLEMASSLAQDDGLPEGWHFSAGDGNGLATYSRNNRAVFALRKGKTHREMTVFTRDRSEIAVRTGMLFGTLTALHEHCVGLHGVTAVCGNKVIILSAQSGTGKTTLSHLLEQYGDAIVINGDFAMLSLDKDRVVFEPTPFCGSSGRCLNQRVGIDQVIFLAQAKENQWGKMTGMQAMKSFMSNAFIPAWESGMQQAIQQNIIEVLARIRVSRFAFAPEREAAACLLTNIK